MANDSCVDFEEVASKFKLHLWLDGNRFRGLLCLNLIFFPEQFVEFYYNQFDSDRKGLASLYVRD